jgi:hypothetical protein
LTMYASDFDDRYPVAVDMDNQQFFISSPQNKDALKLLKDAGVLKKMLFLYTKNNEIWKCPSDVGTFDKRIGIQSALNESTRFSGFNDSVFSKTGTSYAYRVELGTKSVLFPASEGKAVFTSRILGSSEILILSDAFAWHNYNSAEDSGFKCGLFADGHVKMTEKIKIADLIFAN